jgi:hypothetical protein
MPMEPKIPIRTACLYDGGKIESPVKILGREINSKAVGTPTQAKIVHSHSSIWAFQLWEKAHHYFKLITNTSRPL